MAISSGTEEKIAGDSMINKEIAKIFYEISEILKLKNVQWKPQAYNKAARVIDDLEKDLKEIYDEKGLKGLDEISGVGKGIAKKIEEYIKTGKIKEYQKLKKSIPKGLIEMMDITGIGPKKAQFLYKELKIKSIKDLERAVRKHKIKELERFGEKSEKDIREEIEFFKKRSKNRMLLGDALDLSEDVVKKLKAKKILVCGSIRRMYETIGDIDILAVADKNIVEDFCKLADRILAKGEGKASIIIGDRQIDLRVVPKEDFWSGVHYFTGSKDHSVELRKIAIRKGMKLSEYGLFKGERRIAGKSEEEIYQKLGMQYIPPELRENKGEIEAAIKKKIPKLINYNDIKGDLHMHTKHSDGNNSILEMVSAAKKIGYSYIGISDHSRTRKIAGGLTEDELMKEIKEVRKIKISGIKVLIGSEVDILGDGSLDYNDKILKKLDYAIGSIHSGFKGDVTKRILKAMENKYMNILAHPTGRLIQERKGYEIKFDEVLRVAKETKTLLEINAHPSRLDLRDEMIKAAVENGDKLIIGTDAHNVDGLRHMKLGIGQARRGWAGKEDIANTRSWNELRKIIGR